MNALLSGVSNTDSALDAIQLAFDNRRFKTAKRQTDFLEKDTPSEYNVKNEAKSVLEQQAILLKEIEGGFLDMLPVQTTRIEEWISRVILTSKAFMKTNTKQIGDEEAISPNNREFYRNYLIRMGRRKNYRRGFVNI